jgi:hypothetical protein
MTRAIRSLVILALVTAATLPSGHRGATSEATTDGLVVIAEGSAAYYAPGWDGAGWERIRLTQARNHGLDPADVDDVDKFFCVKIGFGVGDILTLRNPATGVVATCRVADVNAPQDNAVWRSRWVVEVSYNLFAYLGLADSNRVEVLVLG